MRVVPPFSTSSVSGIHRGGGSWEGVEVYVRKDGVDRATVMQRGLEHFTSMFGTSSHPSHLPPNLIHVTHPGCLHTSLTSPLGPNSGPTHTTLHTSLQASLISLFTRNSDHKSPHPSHLTPILTPSRTHRSTSLDRHIEQIGCSTLRWRAC